MSTTHTPYISPILRYHDGPAAIEFLTGAFGIEKQSDHRAPDGSVVHADLRFGSSAIGVSSVGVSKPDAPWGQVRQGLYLCVDDPDAYHDRAKAAGAEIVTPLTDMDYGSREFSMRDLDGYLWAFGTYNMGASDDEPVVWPEVRYRNAAEAVRWLERAVGFQTALTIPGPTGDVMHAELRLGRAVFMLGAEMPNSEWADVHQAVTLKVDDPDAHCARAKSAGAKIIKEPQTAPYGARFYAARDPEGFLWWVSNYRPAAP